MLVEKIWCAWKPSVDDLNRLFLEYRYRNLADSICLSDFTPEKANALVGDQSDAIWENLKKGGNSLKSFGVFPLPYVRVMEIRARAVMEFILEFGEDAFLDPNVDMKTLKLMSQWFVMHKETTVYPIKSFVMSKGRQGLYDGMHPNTSPCRLSTEFLVGRDFKEDPLGHRDFCKEIADEVGSNPTDANTFLYLMGKELK